MLNNADLRILMRVVANAQRVTAGRALCPRSYLLLPMEKAKAAAQYLKTVKGMITEPLEGGGKVELRFRLETGQTIRLGIQEVESDLERAKDYHKSCVHRL